MPGKKWWAKNVRVLTAPPILAAILICVLRVQRPDIFIRSGDFAVSLFSLVIFPLLAYPAARLIPAMRQKGREGERLLAFIFCLLAYVFLYIYGLCVFVSHQLLFVYECYLFSSLLLAVVNLFCHVRASGHACGTTGPLLLAGCLASREWIILFFVVFLLVTWASVTLQRHTMEEFLLGSACCVGGFLIAWGQITLVGAWI